MPRSSLPLTSPAQAGELGWLLAPLALALSCLSLMLIWPADSAAPLRDAVGLSDIQAA